MRTCKTLPYVLPKRIRVCRQNACVSRRLIIRSVMFAVFFLALVVLQHLGFQETRHVTSGLGLHCPHRVFGHIQHPSSQKLTGTLFRELCDAHDSYFSCPLCTANKLPCASRNFGQCAFSTHEVSRQSVLGQVSRSCGWLRLVS